MNDYSLPSIPPAKLFQHAVPQMLHLDNGLDFWYVQNEMVPLMSLRIVFPDGAAIDPADKAGRAAMASSMMKEGAHGKTAQQISDEIEFLGATIQPSVNNDTASISVQSMTQFFPQTLDILQEIWFHADFDDDAFERLKKLTLSALKQREDNPEVIAKLASNRAYFGDEHPYGRSIDGYIDTVTALTRKDVYQTYRDLFNPGKAAFIAVGNLDPDTVRDMLNARFGSISPEPTQSRTPDLPEISHALSVHIVDKPNAPQTIIRISQPAIVATSPKTLTWQFVNIPFGASFTSRLMQNIREDKGFSYGAQSVVAVQRHAGVLLSTASVTTEVTGAALHEFLYELDKLPKGDFTQEEFERARETWKSELVQSFETQGGVLATLAGLYVNKKPVDAINAFARELPNYDLDRFNAIAHEFPTTDSAVITLVGDKNAILEQIQDMGLPTPVLRDVEGKRIQP